MENLFDKKGCVFSFVNKEEGDVYLTSEERIADYLNNTEDFVILSSPYRANLRL